jgi:bacillithiol system protein YtxJ
MNWNVLTSAEELDNLIDRSFHQPQVIFKHSTRCATSSMAKNRLEKSGDSGNIEFFLVDVISQRPLSAQVAEKLDVWHESPQAILILNGKAVYDESHISIRMADIKEQCILHSNS